MHCFSSLCILIGVFSRALTLIFKVKWIYVCKVAMSTLNLTINYFLMTSIVVLEVIILLVKMNKEPSKDPSRQSLDKGLTSN